MSRATLPALLVAGVVLAGCPIPQPLPEYSASSITPPRILADDQLAPSSSSYPGAVTLVPANCVTTAPSRVLGARINDANTVESVEARWFVNYDHRNANWSDIRNPQPIVIAPNSDPTKLVRAVPPWTFYPYDYPPPFGMPALPGPPYPDAGVLRVVDLVVSNGFDPTAVGTAEGANRLPKNGFETQVYRWVFLTVPESASVPCP